MTDKMKVPPAILWETTGELAPVDYDWLYIMEVCRRGLTENQKYVILPVEESQDYKPQRRRLIKDDKTSPRGLIQRDEKATNMYYPYASVQFDINELNSYAAEQFNNMPREELERLAEQALRGKPA